VKAFMSHFQGGCWVRQDIRRHRLKQGVD